MKIFSRTMPFKLASSCCLFFSKIFFPPLDLHHVGLERMDVIQLEGSFLPNPRAPGRGAGEVRGKLEPSTMGIFGSLLLELLSAFLSMQLAIKLCLLWIQGLWDFSKFYLCGSNGAVGLQIVFVEGILSSISSLVLFVHLCMFIRRVWNVCLDSLSVLCLPLPLRQGCNLPYGCLAYGLGFGILYFHIHVSGLGQGSMANLRQSCLHGRQGRHRGECRASSLHAKRNLHQM